MRGVSVFALLALACSGSPSGETLTSAQLERYAAVEACVGWSAPAPTVRYGAAIPCPESGRLCCLAGFGYYECPDRPDLNGDGVSMCGVGGEYEDGVILLPEGCEDGFAHEAIHHLLEERTGEPDGDHRSPAFLCEAVT